MLRYMTAIPHRFIVLCIEVHDPGGTERSCRRCTGLAFRKVLFFLTFDGHLSLVLTFRGVPCGAEASGCLVSPWAYK